MILSTSETNAVNAKKNAVGRIAEIAAQQALTGKSKSQLKREAKARAKRKKRVN